MYEDEPSDRVHDVLADAIFGTHPLGRRVLGTTDVIGTIPIPDIASYHRSRYVRPNLVVSAAGNVDHERIVALAEQCFDASPGADQPDEASAPRPDPKLTFYRKDTEQYHFCIGAPGISRSDERRYALSILDTILGGSTSSRLFREVREKRGLAYSVGSYSEQFVDCGTVATYVGTRGENVAEACEIIGRELGSLRDDGVGEDEFKRAKEHVKGRLVLALESTPARMGRNARSALFDLPLLDIDELIAKTDAVTREEVASLARDLYAPERLSAACIGADEDNFRSAIAPVSEALAA